MDNRIPGLDALRARARIETPLGSWLPSKAVDVDYWVGQIEGCNAPQSFTVSPRGGLEEVPLGVPQKEHSVAPLGPCLIH